MTQNVTLPIVIDSNVKAFRNASIISLIGVVVFIVGIAAFPPSSVLRGLGVFGGLALASARFVLGFFIEEYKTNGVLRITEKGVSIRIKGEVRKDIDCKDIINLKLKADEYEGEVRASDMLKGNANQYNVRSGSENYIMWETKDGWSEYQFKIRNASEMKRLWSVFQLWDIPYAD